MARFLLYQRFWTSSNYDELVFGFIALCGINLFAAPYPTRGLLMLHRPLLGIALIIFCIEFARSRLDHKRLLQATILGGLILGIVALTATEWSEGKSLPIEWLLRSIPQITTYPGVEGLFNPNEIAGAMTWLITPLIGLFFYFRLQQRAWAILALAGGTIMLFALLLGQSLSAFIGVLVGFGILFSPRRFWHYAVGMAISLILLIQILIMLDPNAATRIASQVSGRENLISLEHRALLWQSALAMLSDHGLTGVGMNLYRDFYVRGDYPVPGFDWWTAVHAHNEILQIGADLGFPGIFLFIAIYAMAGYLLYYTWRNGDSQAQAIAVALSSGIVAHLIYGLTDAIPLWDRFAFIYWWMLGLVGAQAYLVYAERVKYSTSDERANAYMADSTSPNNLSET
ncbi:MAG: O-antigen ligase family protein [Anaerolineae bacterium]|nr:O-antigen ligase family protein [Anaerolineae bacterium]